MAKKYITKNYKQTQKLGENFGKEILRRAASAQGFGESKAVVLGLKGNLGGGKTTFLQGLAKGLGVKEKILSPTFVILKRFNIKNDPKGTPKKFYHIDCYRLKSEKDILELGFADIVKNQENIIAVEWPEKIKKALPRNLIKINFKFIDANTREINF